MRLKKFTSLLKVKFLFTVLFLVSVFYTNVSFGQTGTSQNDAIPISTAQNCNISDYAINGFIWLSFSPSESNVSINITDPSDTSKLAVDVKAVRLYSSNSGALTVIDSVNKSHHDTAAIQLIQSGLTPGNTYYIQIETYQGTVSTCRACQETPAYFSICVQAPPDLHFCLVDAVNNCGLNLVNPWFSRMDSSNDLHK